jgi:hypothetical protein
VIFRFVNEIYDRSILNNEDCNVSDITVNIGWIVSLTLRAEQRLRVLESRVLRTIFGRKWQKAA